MCAARISVVLEVCRMYCSIHLTILLFARISGLASCNIPVPSNDIRSSARLLVPRVFPLSPPPPPGPLATLNASVRGLPPTAKICSSTSSRVIQLSVEAKCDVTLLTV